MADEDDAALIAAVADDSRYHALVARRAPLGWRLSAIIFFAFVGYLLVIAFDKAALGAPIADGVTSVGIPIRLGLILFGVGLTAFMSPTPLAIMTREWPRSWPTIARKSAAYDATNESLGRRRPLALPDARAGGALEGEAQRQPINGIAIAMFVAFVGLTLWITKVAASHTCTASDFYTAGGGICGFKNGFAMAGDYMSAASFLGISAQIFNDGYDGLIYSTGFLVGWPILLFLMAERLRNLGRFTFADAASYRFAQPPVRSFAALSTLLGVSFYLGGL